MSQKALLAVENCNFGVGLSHWVAFIEYENKAARLKELYIKSLADCQKKVQDQQLEIQKLKEEQHPKKRAKK